MKLKIQIPTQLSEINLDQYQKYLKAIDETESEYKLGSKMIEIFCNIDHADIYKFRVSHIASVSKTLEKVFKQETPTLIKHFQINNIEYGFIPNLDEMTFGEYVDLDNSIKDWQEMHKAMNVLFRPVVQKYSDRYLIEKYKPENNNLLKKIPMDGCFSTIVFF